MNAALLLIALSAAALPITDDIAPQRDKSVYLLTDGDEVAPPEPPADDDLKVIPPEVVSGAYLAVDGAGIEGQDEATSPTYPTETGFPLADGSNEVTDDESTPSDVPVSVSGSYLLAYGDEEGDSEDQTADEPVSVSGSFLAADDDAATSSDDSIATPPQDIQVTGTWA
jgi:hypothetical protein